MVRQMKNRSLGFILVVIFLGAIIGTALGELIGFLLPDGVVEQFFLRSALFGFDPFTINLGIFTFTFGLTVKLNIIGIIGIAFTAYILKWFKNDRRY